MISKCFTVQGGSRSWLLASAGTIAALAALGPGSVLADPSTVEPPNPVLVSGASPFGAFDACGYFPSEITVSELFVDSEVEPWVDVHPTEADHLVAIWQQDRWSDGGSRGNVVAVSTDGGETWGDPVELPHQTDCTGGPWERASDPWLSFSPDGTLHEMSLVFQTDPPGNRIGGFGPNAMIVSRSTDGGDTWSAPITLIEDDDPRVLNDKNSLTADLNDSNFVYAVWDRLRITSAEAISPENIRPGQGLALGIGLAFKGPIYFARTTDGGDTWQRARQIYDPGASNQTIGNQIVVQPLSEDNPGRIIDFFSEILNFKSNDQSGPGFSINLSLLYSDDHGTSWLPKSKPIRAARIFSNGAVTPDLEQPVRDATILFDVAVDPAVGTLYAVWQDTRFTDLEAVAFMQSTDDGLTWSDPIMINQTPSNDNPLREQAFIPSVAVSSEDGVVTVTYYDFRNDDDLEEHELTDHFAVHCHPADEDCTAEASWDEEVRLTNTSFDILEAPFARGFFLGDYVGLAADPTDALAVFTQAGTVTADQSDIFFRRNAHP